MTIWSRNGHLILHDSYLGDWGVQDAIADFMDMHPELQVIQSPFMGRTTGTTRRDRWRT